MGAIAYTIGEEFEKQLLKPDKQENYSSDIDYNPQLIHRYKASKPPSGKGQVNGLLKTAKALKDSNFPRSQIYQIRSFLEQGKHTAMLNYRYFRVRLTDQNQQQLKEQFEHSSLSTQG